MLICASVLAGIIAGRMGLAATWLAVVLGGCAVIALARTRWFGLALVCLAALIGVWRTTVYLDDQRGLTDLIGSTVTFSGVVADDPSTGQGRTGVYLQFSLGRLRDLHTGAELPGEITVRSFRSSLKRGHAVTVRGKLGDGFGNVPAGMFYPEVAVGSTAQSPIERFRQRFFVGLKTAVPEPMASFGLGLLVGVRGLVPRELKDELTLVGLAHLVAVSGANLTIMIDAADRVFKRFGRGIALLAAFWLIGTFLVITGASASIVRAGFVGVLALLARFYGHRFRPLAIILLVAAATALIKPGYLTDLGWLLSFLAFFGVMMVAPAVSARFGNPRFLVAKLLIESVVAHILTVPLVLYFFSQMSVVAPLSNILVVPLVPVAMLVSFIAGLAGMLMPAFCGWLAWPAVIVLSFMLGIVNWFAGLNFADTKDHVTLTVMLVMYGLIVAGTILLKTGNARSRRTEELTDMTKGGALGASRG